MSYWTYYLIWAVLAYGLRTPWLLVGIVVFLVLRRFIPDPAVLFRTLGRIRSLRMQVETNPANVAARRDLARIYIERKRPGRALGLLEAALSRTPNEAELYLLLGMAHRAKGQNEKALGPLVRAVEIDQRVGFGEPYRVAGDALAALARHEEALDAYERFLDYNSSSIEGHLKRARTLARLGERVEASKTVDEACATFGQLPGYARRNQLRWWLRAELARATIQRRPGAILVVAVLSASTLGIALLMANAVRNDLHARHGFFPEHFGIRAFVAPPPSRNRFVRVQLGADAAITKLRNRWVPGDSSQRNLERAHVGDFACRLWALYGPPDAGEHGFSYSLRDSATGAIVTAYASNSGPAYGMPADAPSSAISDAIDDFDALVDATRAVDCQVPVVTPHGTVHVGTHGGAPFAVAEPGDGQAPAESR